MKRALVLLSLFCLGCASAPSTRPWYYYESNLNALSIGMSKQELLRLFEGGEREGNVRAGMQMRAARRTSAGRLLEVGELPMINQATSRITPYWFLFDDGRLIQWGRPEDWRAVSARYEIDFTPAIGVPR